MFRRHRDARSRTVGSWAIPLSPLAVALVAACLPSSSVAATAQRVEAETLRPAHHAGHVVRDPSASGRRALALTGRHVVTAQIRTRGNSRLVVVARAVACASGARLVVAVDGKTVLARHLGARWTDAATSATLGPATHRISLRFAGSRHQHRCGRPVRVDRLVFVPVAKPAPDPAAAPGAKGGSPNPGSPAGGGRPSTPAGGSAPGGRWIPAPKTTWQWQLTTPVDTSVDAQMYDIDLFDNPASVVSALHAAGRHVVCYVDAGTYEPNRPDAGQFPSAVIGKDVAGWPGERWLDVRRLDALGPVMEARMDLCRQKGFDAVEPDNIDGYSNDSGFPLTAADQLRYNRFLAAAAHARGLSIGLKNDLEQAGTLQPDFDWALNEQCFQYGECAQLRPFVQAGKAAFVAEYDTAPASFCGPAQAEGLSAISKKLALDAWRQTC